MRGLGFAVEACIYAAMSAQVAVLLGEAPAWLPALELVGTMLWAVSAYTIGNKWLPAGWGASAWLDIALRLSIFERQQLRTGAITLAVAAIVCAVPGWPSALCFACILGVTLFARAPSATSSPGSSDRAQNGLEWRLKAGLTAAGFVLSSLGIGALALYLMGAPTWIIDAVASGLLMFAMAAIILQDIRRRFAYNFFLERAALQLPAIATPCLLIIDPRIGVAVACAAVTIVVWPAALVATAAYLHLRALDTTRNAIENGIREGLGMSPVRVREDDVRESDGYYRVSYPTFRHWDAALAGENGYLAWIGRQGDPVVGDGSILFRTTTTSSTALADCLDAKGAEVGERLLSLAERLEFPGLASMRDQLGHGWAVRESPSGEVPLIKFPWDHPFLLGIPIDWSRSLVFPPGSGIHDRDGYPCFVRKADVNIRLRRETVVACLRVEDPTPSATDVATCRALVWNAARILPAVYESLLQVLLDAYRERSVHLFLEYGREADALSSSSIRGSASLEQELTRALMASLPDPIRNLVTVAVRDCKVEGLYEAEVRTLTDDYRRLTTVVHSKQAQKANELRSKVRGHVLGEEKLSDLWDPTVPEVAKRTSDERHQLSALIQIAEQRIRDAATASVRKISQSEPGRHANAFAAVQSALTAQQQAFDDDFRGLFSEINDALQEVTAATREGSSDSGPR